MTRMRLEPGQVEARKVKRKERNVRVTETREMAARLRDIKTKQTRFPDVTAGPVQPRFSPKVPR